MWHPNDIFDVHYVTELLWSNIWIKNKNNFNILYKGKIIALHGNYFKCLFRNQAWVFLEWF